MKKQALNLFVGATLCSLFNSILLTACFAPCSSFAQPSYVPTNGLVGWWPFNGNANDESGNGNNGTVNGATLTTDRFGVTNNAYSFDGVDDNIGLGNFFSFYNFTISFWVNPGIQNFHAVIIDNNHFDSNNWVFQAISNFQNNGYNFQNSNEIILSPNVWNHVTLTCNENTLKVYLNDNLISETFWMLNYNNPPSLNLGYWQQANARFWTGKLDDIGIWNRALSETEITALHNSCISTVSSQPLNQTINLTTTNSAQFNIASSVTGLTYQWQTNLGLGFQNLSDAGQYSGTTTNTLNVSNITFANNNQQFRCLVTDGSCADTTDIAVLSVVDDLGITHLQNNASKKLIKITDLNGKETHFRKNTVLVFIYEDGTIERVFEAE